MNWKTGLAVLVALIVGLATLFSIATRLPAPPEHQVFINGEVITMDASNRVVQALSVRNDRIEAVGSTADIMALVTSSTDIVDLHGGTLLPGFIDAHGHFPGSGLNTVAVDLNSPPIGNVGTMAQLLAALAERAAITPAGDWVSGFGYDDTALAESRHPTREELDSVSDEHPVAVLHISGHMAVANSRALAEVGIDETTPNPEGGVIVRSNDTGELTGLLEETARLPVVEKMLDLGVVDLFRMIGSAVREYAAHGVTTAQAGGAGPEMVRGFVLANRLGTIPLRLMVFPLEADFRELVLAGDYEPEEYERDRLQMGAVKIIADGSIQGYTGYLTRPYHQPFHGDAEYRGYPAVLRERLFEQVLRLHSAGFQLAVHGNGDAAIDDILDAFAAAQAAYPVSDPRFILIHSQMARKDQIERMRELGVTPSFFAAHTWYWGDRHHDIFLGPERAATISPAAWAEAAGLRFSSHMDTPVTPMRPLQAAWSLVQRETYAGRVLGPEQRVDAMTALRAVTIDAAWQIFQEDNRGSLEPGKYADLVVLSGSPLAEPSAMRDLRVKQTYVGGALIFTDS
ncbi:amidohydrolase [Kineobactrum sediminis]|uniref:Amidohydrolase n=1 Tax=Kineobactrum sediminis TaxID=1905677 RepID=A0A2N5Y2S6_9GAMM|nr:amidohydrolase [Kineobactrum sediminis]PLW82687.1 amidohydrolase [Kineobactrum sediminis]